MIKIVTHDSGFHTDDVFAVATLLLLVGEAEVIRSRDPEVQATADYLVDTGMKYNPSLRQFDHHQTEGAGKRENNIPYASFGLVWKEYGEKLAGGKREADIIDRILVGPIDAHDNGVAIADYKFNGVREYVIGDFFNSFITSNEQEHINLIFTKVSDIAKELLKREIINAKKVSESEDKLLALYNSTKDKRIIVMSEEYLNWREVLAKTSEALLGIYQASDGHWRVTGVPDLSKPYYGPVRKYLPKEWMGKDGKILQDLTGVEDAIFVHRTGFKGGAKSKEGAIKLAKLALEA